MRSNTYIYILFEWFQNACLLSACVLIRGDYYARTSTEDESRLVLCCFGCESRRETEGKESIHARHRYVRSTIKNQMTRISVQGEELGWLMYMYREISGQLRDENRIRDRRCPFSTLRVIFRIGKENAWLCVSTSNFRFTLTKHRGLERQAQVNTDDLKLILPTLRADRIIVMSQGGWSHGSPSTCTGTG